MFHESEFFLPHQFFKLPICKKPWTLAVAPEIKIIKLNVHLEFFYFSTETFKSLHMNWRGIVLDQRKVHQARERNCKFPVGISL